MDDKLLWRVVLAHLRDEEFPQAFLDDVAGRYKGPDWMPDYAYEMIVQYIAMKELQAHLQFLVDQVCPQTEEALKEGE